MYFLYPNILFLTLIPLLLFLFFTYKKKQTLNRYFSETILKKLLVQNNGLSNKFRTILFLIVLVFFIISLARPVINQKEQEIKQSLIPIVIALDVSKSMMANDIYPHRIELAKKKLKHIIELSKNSLIGVVLFAKNSFILSPVTEDFISLKYIIENIDTNLDFANGSNVFSVLEATSYMLEDFKVKNLIILSDGGNDKKYEKEIDFAIKNNISIYSIGIATEKGAPIPEKNGYLTDKNGKIITVRLNQSIKNLSLKTKGGYIDFTLDSFDIKSIITQINKQSKKEKLNSQKVKIYKEYFYYPLGFSIFILFLAFSSLPKFNLKERG
jgi:Ca-activated chloride channel family protein